MFEFVSTRSNVLYFVECAQSSRVRAALGLWAPLRGGERTRLQGGRPCEGACSGARRPGTGAGRRKR